jgi:hypothetical protein
VTACPFCHSQYDGYRIVGLYAADAHNISWLDVLVPMAMLFCKACGRATLMHPDHPDVQSLPREPVLEEVAQNVRTLNVRLAEVGDEELRHQFEAGVDDH